MISYMRDLVPAPQIPVSRPPAEAGTTAGAEGRTRGLLYEGFIPILRWNPKGQAGRGEHIRSDTHIPVAVGKSRLIPWFAGKIPGRGL